MKKENKFEEALKEAADLENILSGLWTWVIAGMYLVKIFQFFS